MLYACTGVYNSVSDFNLNGLNSGAVVEQDSGRYCGIFNITFGVPNGQD